MKYYKYLLIFTLMFIINVTNIYALSCDSKNVKKLSDAAAYVKASYEVVDYSEVKELVIDGNKTTYKVPNYIFNISIYNVSKELTINVTNDVSDEELNIGYSNTNDGVYTFRNDNFGDIYNYTILVKSNVEGCMGETVRTIKLTKPKYNAYSEYNYCHNSSNYYCQRFTNIDLKIKDNDDFKKKIKVNNEANKPIEEDEEEEKNILTWMQEHYILVVAIGVVIIASVIILIVFLVNRGRLKKHNLNMFILFIMGTMFMMMSVNAECSLQTKDNYRKSLSNVSYDIEYMPKGTLLKDSSDFEVDLSNTFKIKFTNVPKNVRLALIGNSVKYSPNSDNELYLYESGVYTVSFYTNECGLEPVYTYDTMIPYYSEKTKYDDGTYNKEDSIVDRVITETKNNTWIKVIVIVLIGIVSVVLFRILLIVRRNRNEQY